MLSLLDRNDELDMRGMNEDDLMTLCALSGCDYLPSVHGMGLKKAYRIVSRHKEASAFLRHPFPSPYLLPSPSASSFVLRGSSSKL